MCPRRRFRSVNLPEDTIEYIDRIIERNSPEGSPDLKIAAGVQSRDEFVRLAVAVLIMALTRESSAPPLEVIRDLARRLDVKAPETSSTSRGDAQ